MERSIVLLEPDAERLHHCGCVLLTASLRSDERVLRAEVLLRPSVELKDLLARPFGEDAASGSALLV